MSCIYLPGQDSGQEAVVTGDSCNFSDGEAETNSRRRICARPQRRVSGTLQGREKERDLPLSHFPKGSWSVLCFALTLSIEWRKGDESSVTCSQCMPHNVPLPVGAIVHSCIKE